MQLTFSKEGLSLEFKTEEHDAMKGNLIEDKKLAEKFLTSFNTHHINYEKTFVIS